MVKHRRPGNGQQQVLRSGAVSFLQDEIQLRTVITLLLTLYVANVGAKDATTPGYENCVLKQTHWAEKEYLLITWTLPEEILNRSDVQVQAHWNMEENFGTCSEVTLTSCKMKRDDRGSVNFNSDFNLTVAIATNETNILSVSHWWINTRECRQPPKVGHVSAVSVNSTCVKVKWEYTDAQYCDDFYQKFYRLSYRQEDSNHSWSFLNARLETGDTCECSKDLCGLAPYTMYIIGVECRHSARNKTAYGLWSDINVVSVQTKQDVPSTTPEVTFSGFSYAKRNCNGSRTRNVKIYWKVIPEEFRHGIIKGINIAIYKRNGPRKTLTSTFDVSGEESVSSTAVLSCSTSYIVSLKAFTAIGCSKAASSLDIPEDSQVLNIDAEIVPVIREASKNIMINWIFQTNITLNITGYSIFWCRKTLDGSCQSHMSWIHLQPDQHYYLLKAEALTLPAHKYKFGLSVQSYNISSGVLWSLCLYSEDKEVQPPSNIRLLDSTVEGILHVQWDSPSCEGPYILQYIAYICVLKTHTQYNCSGNMTRKETGEENDVVFEGLDSSVQYGIYVVAVTRSQIRSARSKFIVGQTYREKSGLNSAQKALIGVGASVLAILMVVGLVAITRCVWTRIHPPETHIDDIIGQQQAFLASDISRPNGITVPEV